MRSIFWIGCILAVLVSLLASGATAESVNTTSVEAAVAQAENVTDVAKEAAATVGAAAAKAENVTDTVSKAAEAAGLPAVGNMSEKVQEVAATAGAAAEKVENVTATAKEALATLKTESGAEVNTTNATNVSAVVPAIEADLVNDTLVKFVTDAKTFAVNKGKTAAIADFNNPMGGFVNDKMYIFAYDYDGKALALPLSPGMVNQNQIGLTDSSGYRYVQAMRDAAKTGKGSFVKYTEADLMNKGIVMKKTSYVLNVDGNYWIGAGVYVSDDKKPAVIAPVKPPVEINATKIAEVSSSEVPAGANVTASNATAVPA